MSEEVANAMIIRDGVTALSNVVSMIDHLDELCPKRDDDQRYVISNGNVPSHLLMMCATMGLAWSSLFETKAAETKGYIRRAARLRHELLRPVLNAVDTAPLQTRLIRNAIVHADETVLRESRDARPHSWLSNLALSHRDIYAPEKGSVLKYCRVYIISESCLLHLGHELNLLAYRTAAIEALAVMARERPDLLPG